MVIKTIGIKTFSFWKEEKTFRFRIFFNSTTCHLLQKTKELRKTKHKRTGKVPLARSIYHSATKEDTLKKVNQMSSFRGSPTYSEQQTESLNHPPGIGKAPFILPVLRSFHSPPCWSSPATQDISCSSNLPDTCLSQGLCTCWPFHLGQSFPQSPPASLLYPLQVFALCHLVTGPFLSTLLNQNITTP